MKKPLLSGLFVGGFVTTAALAGLIEESAEIASPRVNLDGAYKVADTIGQDNREDRRDDRDDRQDDRQDCRQAEGAGDDKRDCKQDARQDRNSDG